ncbi:hypothetical protein N3K66_005358 [Trichothecium roseum]|uniref:Uncharacterized protein n=1 Tax=Trichothecium roseum TaxID=47278 RepID=A0ACC0UXL4_9HYPO|nr:hypothetical protein N3K66_005358 [Trichothecium roseum]
MVTRRGMNALATGTTRLAVLHQAIDPPVIDGVRKPAKPGGYQDSGADIASCLRANSSSGSSRSRIEVITPMADPDPRGQAGWTFPDTEEGILEALDRGATHLWANTILFAAHPLQTSEEIGRRAAAAGAGGLGVVGQPPALVERYDDKRWVNDMLRRRAGEGERFTLPRSWTLSAGDGVGDWEGHVGRLDLPYPVVGKPIRGRGSYGVKVCRDRAELVSHVRGLFAEEEGSAGGSMLVEEYLGGEEATVAVMPPTDADPAYRALPVVTRFNHRDGIAPYSGEVAVSVNSKAVLFGEGDGGVGEAAAYEEAQRQCERVAAVLGVTAPIRIDVRRFSEEAGSPFALFDVNMKPNMTGPGRPGRDEQASLVLLAAQALGWDYARLLETIVGTANTLDVLRSRTACE